MKMIPLPTQFLYEFQIDQDLVDRSLEYFLNLGLTSAKADIREDFSAEVMMRDSLSKFPTCIYHKELFAEIQKCIDQIGEKHFKDTRFSICDSWLTRSHFGQKSGEHHHAYSIFSGLLYMTDQERSETKFLLSDPFYKQYESLFNGTVKDQSYTYDIKPEKGKLIIWDSSIKHKIGTVSEKNTRYTLAFNTWPTGIISHMPTRKLMSNVVDVAELSQKD